MYMLRIFGRGQQVFFAKIRLLGAVVILAACASGCSASLQRGLLDGGCVSTARPAIYMKASLPLLSGGKGRASLSQAGVMGGLPVDVWLGVYGAGGEKKTLAVAALADLPEPWHWDSDGRRSGCLDEGVEIFGDVAYQACTFLVENAKDPFALLAGTAEDGSKPLRWLARSFVARFNHNASKVLLEYREALPLAAKDNSIQDREYLRAFAAKAHEIFLVTSPPASAGTVMETPAQNIRWQYLDSSFLGTVSRYDTLPGR